MEKYDKIIDLIDHPENYSEGEIVSILADDEMKEIYNTLSLADSSFKSGKELSKKEVEAEWKKFFLKDNIERKKFVRTGKWCRMRNYVAVALVAVIALGAVAFEIGLNRSSETQDSRTPKDNIVNISVNEQKDGSSEAEKEGEVETDTIILFENESLEKILGRMSEFYGTRLKVDHPESMQIRLFLRWDPKSSREEIIRRLNNFEKINLTLDKDTIIVR